MKMLQSAQYDYFSKFRKKILKEYACDQTPDQVIQINIQMFPLTKTDDKGDI